MISANDPKKRHLDLVDQILNRHLDRRRAASPHGAVERPPQFVFAFIKSVLCLALLFALTQTAHAHLGSKDVFEQVTAGPYELFITIRPPNVIPGVATVEVRASGAAINSLQITPTPLTGEAAQHPPTADQMKPSADDPQFFTGGVWMMASGSWQVRFQIDGAGGRQSTAIPVPAMALSTLKMTRALGLPLAALGLFLVLSMAGVVAAAIRESRLPPGQLATPPLRRRGLVAMGISLAVMALVVYGGAKWWNVEAASYAEDIYRSLVMRAQLTGNQLDLRVQPHDSEDKRSNRANDDFLPDHGHPMHLYAIRQPQMDAVFHLHPEMTGKGDFRLTLPAMPSGEYKLYGDVVHANGFPETLVATVDVPADLPVRPCAGICPDLESDDARALPKPLSAGQLGPAYKLPDGYTMVWDKPATLTANTAYSFRFRLVAPDGKPATNMQPYMGMAGHAAFIKTDGSVFAHTHPEGSAAMAAIGLANGGTESMPMGDHAHHDMSVISAAPLQPSVDFPYGFPTPGPYRIVIQMKRANTVETGVFDATVR